MLISSAQFNFRILFAQTRKKCNFEESNIFILLTNAFAKPKLPRNHHFKIRGNRTTTLYLCKNYIKKIGLNENLKLFGKDFSVSLLSN